VIQAPKSGKLAREHDADELGAPGRELGPASDVRFECRERPGRQVVGDPVSLWSGPGEQETEIRKSRVVADDDGFADDVRQRPQPAQQRVCGRVVELLLEDDLGRAESGENAIERLGRS
jgi:hypothetical protein